jgi:hypothetical protein
MNAAFSIHGVDRKSNRKKHPSANTPMLCSRFFSLLWLFVILNSAVHGETIRLSNSDQVGAYHGVEDTTIKSTLPDASFGGSHTLEVGSTERTLVRFSTASLPASTKIDHATVELVLEKTEGDWKDAEIVVYPVAAAAAGWSAGQADSQLYFLGDSYNATPLYRITGWDKFERQRGKVELK